MLVFVYGTLKSGHGNNPVLGKSKFVKKTRLPGHVLYHAGFPVMTPSYDEKSFVEGEVYEVTDEATLYNLDRLEGEGRMYDRTKTHDIDGVEVSTYIGCNRYWDNFKGRNNCRVVEENGNMVHSWPK